VEIYLSPAGEADIGKKSTGGLFNLVASYSIKPICKIHFFLSKFSENKSFFNYDTGSNKKS